MGMFSPKMTALADQSYAAMDEGDTAESYRVYKEMVALDREAAPRALAAAASVNDERNAK